jgi:hypothetical protein
VDNTEEYSSFMLRFRRMQREGQPTWVVSVHTIQTGQVVCFPRLDGLIEFLQARFGKCIELEAVSLQIEDGSERTDSENGAQPFEG